MDNACGPGHILVKSAIRARQWLFLRTLFWRKIHSILSLFTELARYRRQKIYLAIILLC